MRIDRRSVLGGFAATVVPLRAVAGQSPALATVEAGSGTLRLKDRVETAAWAFNGQVPGPLLRTLIGKELQVSFANKLSQPTSLCLHGVRIDNAMSGVVGLTQPPVMPGAPYT